MITIVKTITGILVNIGQDLENIKDLRTEIAFLLLIGLFLWLGFDALKTYWLKIRLRELEVKEKEIEAEKDKVRYEQDQKNKRAEMLNKTQGAMVDKIEQLTQAQKESNFALEDVAERMTEIEHEQVQIKEKIGEMGATCKTNTNKLLILGDREKHRQGHNREGHKILLGTEGT